MEWQDEWQDMPEFIQVKKEPYAKIIFRFRNEDDLAEFSKKIGQPQLNNKSKSAWYPELPRGLDSDKIYVSED